MLWEEVTQGHTGQGLSWVPCPSPVSQGTVSLPPLEHCSAPQRGSSRWGGSKLWATFPLLHGGFPCWTSSSLHVQWELGADLEQLLWSLLEPHPRHCQRCFHPFLLCFFQLLWSPLGTAGTVSSMHPISHLSQSRGWEAHVVRGHSLLRPLVPPWQGSEGQMPAEHFIQRQVMLHWRNPPLTPSLMSIRWQSPKTPPALEPEPCC